MSDVAPSALSSETGWLDLFEPVRTLAAENDAAVQRLRGAQIPQHVGMATACRVLAVDLPREQLAQIDAELANGELARRWEAALAAASAPGASGELDSTLFAIAVLLREHSRAAMRHLVVRGKDWTADAYRLEGQAAALEAQAERLRRVAGPADAAIASADAGDGANLAEAPAIGAPAAPD
jgi:hypothetical protein